MRYLACLALLATAGCTSASAPPPAVATGAPVSLVPAAPAVDPLTQLHDFTVADLRAASADAKAQNPPDTAAAQCYDFLAVALPSFPSLAPGSAGAAIGAVLAFQKARDLANGTVNPNGALSQLNLACAPLVIDVQTTVNKLLLVGAGTAATGGALGPALPGLSAIGGLLPIPLR